MMAQENTTQQKIIDFIEDYRRENGFVPQQSVIARELKMTRQNVHYYFQQMKEELEKFPEYKRYSFNQTEKESAPTYASTD